MGRPGCRLHQLFKAVYSELALDGHAGIAGDVDCAHAVGFMLWQVSKFESKVFNPASRTPELKRLQTNQLRSINM